MPKQKKTSLESELLDLISRYSEILPATPWADERERWHELLVCTLFAYGGAGRGKSRQAMLICKELGLLAVESLAAIPVRQGVIARDHPVAATLVQILRQLGFVDKDISKALTHVVLLAQAICSRFGGKIQRYLRSQGETMLARLEKDFPELYAVNENRTADEDASWRFAFSMWLQNSLTLPIFLDTANTRRFCRHAGCRMVDLQAAADRLDINAALMDDLLDLWAAEGEHVKKPAGKER